MSAPARPREEGHVETVAAEHCNEVRLVGRVAAIRQVDLPSGDIVATVRLVVERGPGERRPPHVDTVECAAWLARPRRSLGTWRAGDLVAVEGRLHRRFWRGEGGLRSRYEVEVLRARRLARADS